MIATNQINETHYAYEFVSKCDNECDDDVAPVLHYFCRIFVTLKLIIITHNFDNN